MLLMNYVKLNDENFMSFAMKMYTNPQCTKIEEFMEDMDRFKYLKRLFRKYKFNGILRERLILNHLIILYNVFDIETATRLLFFRLEKELYPYLKTFLLYLKYLPKSIPETDLVRIPLDPKIINTLRMLEESNEPESPDN